MIKNSISARLLSQFNIFFVITFLMFLIGVTVYNEFFVNTFIKEQYRHISQLINNRLNEAYLQNRISERAEEVFQEYNQALFLLRNLSIVDEEGNTVYQKLPEGDCIEHAKTEEMPMKWEFMKVHVELPICDVLDRHLAHAVYCFDLRNLYYIELLTILIVFLVIAFGCLLMRKMAMKKIKTMILDPLLKARDILTEDLGYDENKVYENEIDFLYQSLKQYQEYFDRALQSIGLKRNRMQRHEDLNKKIMTQQEKFISSLTHEMNIPLTIMLGYLEQLKKDPSHYLEKSIMYFDKNMKRLQRIIENTIQVVKLGNFDIPLNIEQYSILAFFAEIEDEYRDLAAEKGLTLTFRTDIKNDIIGFDPVELRKVFENLISNSIKFTNPKGMITVYAEERNDDYLLGVKDTGKGIEKKHIENVFTEFYQAENKPATGLGLGLFIVKKILEKHGFELGIKSEEDTGTDIFFMIKKNIP